ncbi:hypothetical protein KIM372_15400 [Bombiscardovia nodaiensis]|uniref:Uncharacterized protein n=1 Tax=Bombiscardovia nodaiensis TaxID=2932181 RepID=A0ABN6SDJ3_9BIFI|nr:hypothetical protein KIM372_15400 [Bombiscardovia nodaiensis]
MFLPVYPHAASDTDSLRELNLSGTTQLLAEHCPRDTALHQLPSIYQKKARYIASVHVRFYVQFGGCMRPDTATRKC